MVTDSRPHRMCSLEFIQDSPPQETITGMIDTEADVTLISKKQWPSTWPTVLSAALAGVGGTTASYQSRSSVSIINPDEHIATISPYVNLVPLNLRGHDCLTQ